MQSIQSEQHRLKHLRELFDDIIMNHKMDYIGIFDKEGKVVAEAGSRHYSLPAEDISRMLITPSRKILKFGEKYQEPTMKAVKVLYEDTSWVLIPTEDHTAVLMTGRFLSNGPLDDNNLDEIRNLIVEHYK